MNIVSLDIGTYSIKCLNFKSARGQLEVVQAVEVPNHMGIAIPTDEISRDKLSEQVDSFFSDHSLSKTDTRLALPESVVSTKVISVPVLSDAELASAIGWQAEQHLPIPKEDLAMEYQVLYRPERAEKDAQMRILLVGSRKSLIDRYTDVFKNVGIEPTCLETQTSSILRAAQITPDQPVTMVVHIGFSTMDISIVHGGELTFVFSHPNGGLILNRALESALQLPPPQAEEYKRTYGLDPRFFEGKVQAALMPAIKSFIEHMQRAMYYHSMQYPSEKVERILLSGGTANLPSLVAYIASTLGVEVLFLNPFNGVTGNVPQSNPTSFSVCAGLGMRKE